MTFPRISWYADTARNRDPVVTFVNIVWTLRHLFDIFRLSQSESSPAAAYKGQSAAIDSLARERVSLAAVLVMPHDISTARNSRLR